MICSMTGYGSGKSNAGNATVEVEIRSVNGRSRDIRCNFPRDFLMFENDIRDVVKKQLSRGQITVFLKYNMDNTDAIPFNKSQVREAVKKFKELAKSAGLSPEGNLDTLLRFLSNNNILKENFQAEKLRAPLMKATAQALKSHISSRAKEGIALVKDIKSRIKTVDNKNAEIKKLAPQVVKAYQKKVNNRIDQLKKQTGVEFDPVRVITEIGIFSERIDITEELTRLKVHTNTFVKTLNKGGVIGKRLDFILQEMFRETTTIGNKCNNADISSLIVIMKEELEKMREQVQNLE
jgi:uncharacterized protein (TIGR00255 family)